MTTTWDVLTASSIVLDGATLLRTADDTTDGGARMVIFTDDLIEVRVFLWPDGSTVLELLDRSEFVYGCSRSSTDDAFKWLREYAAARKVVRS